jgi:hypothetical protein
LLFATPLGVVFVRESSHARHMLEIRLLFSPTASFGRRYALLGEGSEHAETTTKLRARGVDHREAFASHRSMEGTRKFRRLRKRALEATNVGSISEKKLKTRKMVASPAIRTKGVPRQLSAMSWMPIKAYLHDTVTWFAHHT